MQERTKTSEQNSSTKISTKKMAESPTKTSPPKKRNKLKEAAEGSKQKTQNNQAEVDDKRSHKAECVQKEKERQPNRFERIPIMRRDEDYRNTCNMVYRNFAPRSSETYFKTLKSCNYDNLTSTSKFRPGQNYIFNSKFEGGNLSAAF